MRTRWSLVALLVAVTASAGSPAAPLQTHPHPDVVSPAGARPKPSSPMVTSGGIGIRGVVVDVAGAPIQGASVAYRPAEYGDGSVRWSGRDDERDGSLRTPRPSAITPGCRGDPSRLCPRLRRDLRCDVAADDLPVRLQMTAGGRIEGVALQKHGTPLAGLRVEVQTSGDGRVPECRLSSPPPSKTARSPSTTCPPGPSRRSACGARAGGS